ncbi:MAG TPA: VTT domain-containing protein [Candidatus Angelobacter sp.]|nr:VTT domain-containing protein [Candidatus Angelobacter sp.]
MSLKAKLLLKYSALIAALKALGAWGVLIIAALDASAFGIPMDPLIAGFVYANPHKAWLYCVAAAVGSAAGSLIPYWLGRAGGELFLLKRIDQARLERIRDRFEKREFLAIMIPGMLPPPTPFKLLVFSAGAFKMKVRQFVLAIICGRLLRFGILSVLTVIFGQQIVEHTKDLVKKHPSVAVLVGIVVLVVFVFIYRMFREPATQLKKEIDKAKA